LVAKVILNPYAGRWKARDNIPRLESALKQAGISYELVVTSQADEGIEIAEKAARAGFSPVIAVGGDSTCNEVVNGLIAAAGEDPTTAFGVIPLGTANDLVYGQGIPGEIEAAVKLIARGKTRVIDVGQVNGRCFANNSAVGLEPVITLENARLIRVRGTIRYLIAALICIARRPTWNMTIEWDGDPTSECRYQGPSLLVSVGNHRRTGGVFFMTPNALPDDGLLDFVFAPALPRLKLLRLLPMTFSGAHVNRPEVTEGSSRSIRITSEPGTPIQTDGEVFELNASEIHYQVIPDKLTIIVDR